MLTIVESSIDALERERPLQSMNFNVALEQFGTHLFKLVIMRMLYLSVINKTV